MSDLGQFAAGVASWRKLMAVMPDDEGRWKVFGNAAREIARYVPKGLDRTVAVDELQDIAVAYGLHDQDEVQRIVADAFHGIEPIPDDNRPKTNGKHSPRLLILRKREFIMGFRPPDFVIEGMLQRQFVYALTGQTGHAKSAIALLLGELVSSGDPNSMLGTHRVEKGQVAYFVGENPDDIRMRVIGADSFRHDDPLLDRIVFIPGVFNIEEMFQQLTGELATHGNFDLVIVDTSAAYFLGNEELSNTQMGAHARMLRSLTTLPGGPCVLVLCHPIKYASEPSQLLPRGGGAFLAEMDGNLTAFKHDDVLIELSYNKIRGPGFEPMTFKLETIRPEKLVDLKGRQISTVRAVAITETEEDQQKDKARDDDDHILALRLRMLDTDQLSYAKAAEECGWHFGDGTPAKSRVSRVVDRLEKAKLVRRERGQWLLTEKGKEAARKAAMRLRAVEDARKQDQFDLQYPH
jgi:hypothetical protein